MDRYCTYSVQYVAQHSYPGPVTNSSIETCAASNAQRFQNTAKLGIPPHVYLLSMTREISYSRHNPLTAYFVLTSRIKSVCT